MSVLIVGKVALIVHVVSVADRPVGSIVPLADVVAAHEMLAGTRPHKRGKIVIEVNPR